MCEEADAVGTSQCGRQQKVCAILPDDVLSDGSGGRPSAQVPDGLHELGVERQGHAIVLLSLQRQAAHFPAAKLSAKSHPANTIQLGTVYQSAPFPALSSIKLQNINTFFSSKLPIPD